MAEVAHSPPRQAGPPGSPTSAHQRPWGIGFCATTEFLGEAALAPAQRDLLAEAGPTRRRELATGRGCASSALAQVGWSGQGPLLSGAGGAPLWPAGFVGSITHTQGWTGAVAVRRGWRRGVRGIGLDAEVARPLPEGVLEVLASPAEQRDLGMLRALDPGTIWPTVLFTVKEAAYKAVHPMTGVVLSHDDVAVDLSPDGRFTATTRTPGRARSGRRHRVRGRWTQGPGVVVSLAVVD